MSNETAKSIAIVQRLEWDAMHRIPTGQFPGHNRILSIFNASLVPQVALIQIVTDKDPPRQNGVTSFTVASCSVLSGVRI